MYSYYNHPKPPKWIANVELATQKLWYITSGKCATSTALQICNHIITASKLPPSLKRRATIMRDDIIRGRKPKSKKVVTTHEVIQLSAHRK